MEYATRYGGYLDHGGKTAQEWLQEFRSDPQAVREAIDAWQLTASDILVDIQDCMELNDRRHLDVPGWFSNLTSILALWADVELRIDPTALCEFNEEVQGYRSRNVIAPGGKVARVDPPLSLERAEALLKNAGTVWQRMLRVGQRPADKPARRTRRGTKPRKPRPLTGRQVEAVQVVGECKGDIAKAAKRLGLHRKTVAESYKAGLTKLGKVAVKHGTRLFPRDRRGQEDIAEGDDTRRQ
jgi:hypothetical protein